MRATQKPLKKQPPRPQQVNVHEAKTHFSELLARVQRGEEIVIAKSGQRVAKLVPFTGGALKALHGSAKGDIIWMSPDFDAADAEIERMFYGEDEGDGAPHRPPR